MNKIKMLEKNQNFISADYKTAINSYGEYYTVGELVKHEDDSVGFATILSFEIDANFNEVGAITNRGYTHIDFLAKIKNS